MIDKKLHLFAINQLKMVADDKKLHGNDPRVISVINILLIFILSILKYSVAITGNYQTNYIIEDLKREDIVSVLVFLLESEEKDILDPCMEISENYIPLDEDGFGGDL